MLHSGVLGAIEEPLETRACGASARALGPHRLLLPHAAAWVEGSTPCPQLASACTAVLLAPDTAIRIEPIDPSFSGADLIELPGDLWSRVRRTLEDAVPDLPSGPWRWNWTHVDADQYRDLRCLMRQPEPGPEQMASWVCTQLRRAIADWRRTAMRMARAQRAAKPGQHRVVQRAAREIATHWREGISLQALAERAEMSVFHLLRSFRSCHGLTPHQFLLQLRLRRSLHLLDQGHLSGAALAEETGFCSHGHFCTAFRSAFGRTPSEYLAANERRHPVRAPVQRMRLRASREPGKRLNWPTHGPRYRD